MRQGRAGNKSPTYILRDTLPPSSGSFGTLPTYLVVGGLLRLLAARDSLSHKESWGIFPARVGSYENSELPTEKGHTNGWAMYFATHLLTSPTSQNKRDPLCKHPP